ncbi:MAG: FYDLN acid domain-containing protein [Alphaproteobacteria bacterium]
MKPEWGQKRKYLKCDAFFYDMRQDSFSCPKCKEHYTADSYEEAKHKQLLKLAKKAAPKIDDEDLNEEALLQMTEDVPLSDEELNADDLDILEETDDLTDANPDISDIMDTYDDDEKHDG